MWQAEKKRSSNTGTWTVKLISAVSLWTDAYWYEVILQQYLHVLKSSLIPSSTFC